MNAEETQVCELLKQYDDQFVSVTEISKRLGHRKCYDQDRNWVRPILRRMEMDALVESNPFGEYKLCRREGDTARFKAALDTPGASLGDTTIIFIGDVKAAS